METTHSHAEFTALIKERNHLLTRINNLENELEAAEKVLRDWGHYDEYERTRSPFRPAM